MTRTVKFTKMHGAGNDYIYVNTLKYPIESPEKLSVEWSAPHTGIGSDGLVLIGSSDKADFSMRIFNADGSEAKMCGNASRCIGKYLYEYGLTSQTAVTLDTLSGIKTLRNTVHKVLGDDLKEVFIQGNHDAVCDLIASTGAHDTAAYGVFVVNEDDYQQGDMVNEELNKAVAAKMRAYFSEKAAMNYSKPIFVCSHVPLHTTARPSKDFVPGDAKYAQYLFDVLNEFGDRLNIIFLYGHDHSNGWDSYLGGSSVYLKPGDNAHVR